MTKLKCQRKWGEPLSETLEKRVLNYALAANLSGVAVLALAQLSQAEVVYTPANQSIWANGGILDLNNDGTADFRFTAFSSTDHTSCAIEAAYVVYVAPAAGSNAIRGAASALPSSILVGKNPQKFIQGKRLMAGKDVIRWICTSRSPQYGLFGPFANKSDRYLALQFSINGETHYGWARFSVYGAGIRISAFLTGYAYETTPNAPIFTGGEFGAESREIPNPATQGAKEKAGEIYAPRAATLGRLAQGSSGLKFWRK